MAKIEFVDNHIELESVPKRLKKNDRYKVCDSNGLNVWSTPLKCGVSQEHEEPFVDSIYTIAGK